MDFLAENNNLKIAFTVCAIIYIILTLIIYVALRKKGVNVDSLKNTLKIGLAFSPIIMLPVWFEPIISVKAKAIISIIMGIAIMATYYSLHYNGRFMRKLSGTETEEDKREAEREEKAKKEKEAKGKHE